MNLLEIGVGGYDDPKQGGHSLRMWKDYFPNANIYAIDLYDKSALQEPRIHIFQGSQADPDFLKWVAGEIGQLDIVIDDGSHVNEHVIVSFQTLFPLLADNGIYAIEDLHTAYLPDVWRQPRSRLPEHVHRDVQAADRRAQLGADPGP